MGIEVQELVQGRRDLVSGCLGEGRCMFDNVMQVSVFQLRRGWGEDKGCGCGSVTYFVEGDLVIPGEISGLMRKMLRFVTLLTFSKSF